MPPAERTATRKRSIAKALTYRVVIVCLDFLAIYLFTRKVDVALGFMLVSNIYTTFGYFMHERMWARISWGITSAPPESGVAVMSAGRAREPG